MAEALQNQEAIGYLENSYKVQKQEVITDTDLKYADNMSLKVHNEYFTELLEIYVDNARTSLRAKKRWKNIFFYFSIALLFIPILVVVVVAIGMFESDESFIDCLLALITASIPLVTAILVIPQTIAKYLFDSQEENSMVDIVTKVQDYDSRIRGSELHNKHDL